MKYLTMTDPKKVSFKVQNKIISTWAGLDAGHLLPQREERPLPQHPRQQRLHQVQHLLWKLISSWIVDGVDGELDC